MQVASEVEDARDLDRSIVVCVQLRVRFQILIQRPPFNILSYIWIDVSHPPHTLYTINSIGVQVASEVDDKILGQGYTFMFNFESGSRF